jgi:hypothetical protein
LGEGVPDTFSERPPERVVWCFMAVAVSSAAGVGALCSLVVVVVVVVVGAGAWCAGAGSADSRAPVSDWKPASSLAEVMVMLFRQIAAARVACWVQCGSGEARECLDSSKARPQAGRLGGDAARSRWMAPQRQVFAVDAGEEWRAAGCIGRGCGAGRVVKYDMMMQVKSESPTRLFDFQGSCGYGPSAGTPAHHQGIPETPRIKNICPCQPEPLVAPAYR